MTIPVPLDDQLKELEREMAMRRKVYPRQIELCQITKEAAEKALARLIAARDTLLALKRYAHVLPRPLTAPRNVTAHL